VLARALTERLHVGEEGHVLRALLLLLLATAGGGLAVVTLLFHSDLLWFER